MSNPPETQEWFYLSLQEITASFGVSKETIIDIVNEGIVSVEKRPGSEWQFDNDACKRIRIALRLTNDLGVNLAGAALALELLEEIERLRNT